MQPSPLRERDHDLWLLSRSHLVCIVHSWSQQPRASAANLKLAQDVDLVSWLW